MKLYLFLLINILTNNMVMAQVNTDTIKTYLDAIKLNSNVLNLSISTNELIKFNKQISFLNNLENLSIESEGFWLVTIAENYYEIPNFDIDLLDKYLPLDLFQCDKLKSISIQRFICKIPKQVSKLRNLEKLEVRLINTIQNPIDMDKVILELKKLSNLKEISITGSKIGESMKMKLINSFKDIIQYD